MKQSQTRNQSNHTTEALVKPAGRKPTHRLYCVKGEGDNTIWIALGAAWPNKDGMGFNLSCDAVPLQGRLVLRAIRERASSGGQADLAL